MGKALSGNDRPGLPMRNHCGIACVRRYYALIQRKSGVRVRPEWYRPRILRKALVVLVFSLGVDSFAGDSSGESAVSRPPPLVSTKIFDAVAAKLPKYVAATPARETGTKSPDVSEEGTSGTMKLPKITVRPTALGPPVEAEVMTLKERLALAMKANPGLRIGNIFGANGGIALFMATEERELKAKEALAERIRQTTSDDGEAAKAIQRLLKKASYRINADWQNQRAGSPTGP